MLIKLSCITLCILCICDIIISVTGIEVQTNLGTIKGKYVEDDLSGARYYSFEGIPYAEPPVGSLRYKPPVQIKPSPTVIDATKPGYVCPQTDEIHSRKEMNEDCLNFNIYTPANNNFTKLLPVLFNIHGGDFAYLSGKAKPVYGPQLLIPKDMVVVSVNYRLGALGFLSLCNEEVSGNAGLKDLFLALKIVHENIRKFGGNPNKITISGDGAGAILSELLMLTKEANGLFQSVILYSGSVLSPEYMQLNPRENARLLGRELGIDMSNDEVMMDKLRRVDPFDIIKVQDALELEQNDPQRGVRIFRPFKPVVEIECEGAILTRPPLDLIREGAMYDVPMVIGFNDLECLEILPVLEKEPQLLEKLNKNLQLLIPADIKYPNGSEASKNLEARIKDMYFDGGDINFPNIKQLLNLLSDTKYTVSIDLFIQLFKEKYKSSVYYYVFAADTELNWYKAIKNITFPGAAHLDKIGYYFFTSITQSRYQHLKSDTKFIQTRFLGAIKNFMDYGNPLPNDDSWPEAGQNNSHIDEGLEIVPVNHGPRSEKIGFWKSVYEEYYNSKYYTANNFCSSTA